MSYPEDLRALVDARAGAAALLRSAPATAGLEEAMRYSLLAGGKRVRPVLALATARALGADPQRYLPAAAAIELIHTYSLIHDDLPAMDDDDLRRGKPTSHVKFGEDVAILAGDGLFAEAVAALLRAARASPAACSPRCAELSGGDRGRRDGRRPVRRRRRRGRADAEGLRALHALKTGRLIAASVGVVLALEGVREPETIPYRRFADELGVLFQIVDDILDVTGSDERARQAPWKRRATWQTHLRQPLRPRAGARARGRVPREGGRRRWPRPAARPATCSGVADYIFTRNE